MVVIDGLLKELTNWNCKKTWISIKIIKRPDQVFKRLFSGKISTRPFLGPGILMDNLTGDHSPWNHHRAPVAAISLP